MGNARGPNGKRIRSGKMGRGENEIEISENYEAPGKV